MTLIMNIGDDSNTGYIIEVDLEYPKELHDMHNDLPFCCEMKKICGSKTEKLITDFHSKTNYVMNYSILKQCIENELELTSNN